MDTKSLFKKAVNLLTLGSFLLWNLSVAAPEGGSVAQGSAAISQSGTVTTVNQTSQNAVINWQSFNTASNEAVKFNQPNSSAVALNRINNGLPTQFAGQLSANGNVWILNPAGVLFTSTSRVDVAGLLATTHSISDANFMAGNYKFDLVPGSEASSIINNGLISAKDSGLVALVAPHVENNGLIQVNFGRVALASGASYTLDMYGDNLINFGSNAPISKGSVSNAGQIIANGGKVYMTANAAAGVLDNVISMSGTIQATSVTNGPHGEIILNGGKAGTVKVSGKLNTSGSNGAPGGTIETSGDNVIVDSMAEINAGVGGQWILDPPVIYTSTWGTLISDQLNAGTNVTLSTGVSGLGAGDIYLDASISWSTSAVLMLGAYRNINISAPVSASNSGGFIARADLSGNGTGTVNFSGSGSVTVNGANGYAKLFYNPSSYASPTDYSSFLSGSAPIKAGYMMINNLSQFNSAVSSYTNSALDSYSLNTDINASSFTSTIFPGTFSGSFEGHDYATGNNHVIYDINMTFASNNHGAFVTTLTGSIFNLGIETCLLANCSTGSGANVIAGAAGVAGVSGFADAMTGGLLTQSYFVGNITGLVNLAGLVRATTAGTISNSYAQGTIVATGGANSPSAGLIATPLGGTLINSFNAMSVSGNVVYGGISGIVANPSTFTNVYNVGSVNGGTHGAIAGNPLSLSGTGLYWDTATANQAYQIGSGPANVPLSDAQMQVAANFTTFDFTNTWVMGTTLNGVAYPYPQLRQNSMTINSTALGGSIGASASGQTVNVYADNTLIGSAVVGSNGEYLMNFNPDTVFASNPNIIMATTSGASVTGSYLGKFYGPVGNLNIANNTVTVRSDTGVAVTNSEIAGLTNGVLFSGSGNNIILNSGSNFLTTAGVVYSSVLTTTATAYNLNGNIDPGVDVTFNGPVTVTVPNASIINTGNTTFFSTLDGPQDLTINSGGSVTFYENVGGITPLSALAVTAGNLISVNPNANTHTVFNILTSGNQTYTGTIQLTPNTIALPPNVATDNFQSSSGDVAFNGPVTLTSGSGTILLMMNAGNDIHINGALLLDPTPFTSFSGGTIDFTAGNKIYLNTTTINLGNQPSSSNFFFSGYIRTPALLSQDLTITASQNAFLNLLSTIDTDPNSLVPHSLTMNINGLLDMFGSMGASQALSQIDVTGTVVRFQGLLNPLQFVTTGDQSYTQTFFVGLFPGITFNQPSITFTSLNNGLISLIGGVASFQPNATMQINGNAYLQGNNSFNPNFFNNSGSSGSFGITVTGNTEMDNVIFASQAGNQIYQGNVTITNNNASLSTTSGHIEFGGNVNSVTGNSAALTLSTPSGYTQFDGIVNVVAGTDPLASLTMSDPIIFNGSTFNIDNYAFGSSIGITSLGGIVNANTLATFNNTVDGFALGDSGTLFINGHAVINNPVGGTTPLSTLEIVQEADINTSSIHTTTSQLYDGVVMLGVTPITLKTDSSGSITFSDTVDGATDLTLDPSTTGTVTFMKDVGGNTPLLSLHNTGDTIIGGSALRTITTANSQQYDGNVKLNSSLNINTTNSSQTITFGTPLGGGVIEGPGGLFTQNFFSTTTFYGSVGKVTPLDTVTLNSFTVQINLSNLPNFEIDTNGGLGHQYGVFMTIGGDVTFNAASGGEIHLGNITGPYNVVATVTGISPFGDIRLLGADVQNLTLTSPNGITFQNSAIQTTGDQTYNGNVNSSSGTSAQLASLNGNITFNGTITGSNFEINQPSFVPGSGNGSVKFKGNIDITATPTSHLWVDGNIINFSNAVSSITSNGSQIYTSVGSNPLLTVDADPVFMAPSFTIGIPVLINANTTYTSTAGNIDFQQAITGDGASSLTLNPVGGSAMFENTVGTNPAPLGSLIINGTSLFDQGSAQTVYTNGNQTYADVVTIQNDISMTALTTGAIALGADGAVPVGGITDGGAGRNVTLLTNNAANGPTGAGITGYIIQLGSIGTPSVLTAGGAGGANISPVSQTSTVNGSTGNATFAQTTFSPQFASTLYCINNFCTTIPVPPVNIPNNIPQLELFNFVDGGSYCSGSGCSNLEIIMDNVAEVGVVNCVFGFMEAISESGSVRILMPGDMLYAGDTVRGSGDSQVCVKDVSSNKVECHKGSQA